jgi:methyl-accepting chemotaxis protein
MNFTEAARLFDERVRRFQRGLLVTALVAVPAVVLVASVLGDWTQRELLYIVAVVVVIAGLLLPTAHYIDRRTLGFVRDRMDRGSGLSTRDADARLKNFRFQIVINFLLAYVVGGLAALTLANELGGFPILKNVIPFAVAAFVGVIVDAGLNVLTGETLIAELGAIVMSVRKEDIPLSVHARGGISNRFALVIAIVIIVMTVTMGGAAAHLLLELDANAKTPASALRQGEFDLLGTFLVAAAIAVLASRILSRAIANPILHIVALMERLRQGDVLEEDELYREPRYPHEAGLLVAAFAGASAGLRRLASSGDRLASGDLAVNIVPFSDRDVVAVAFGRVTDVIRTVVGNVRATAELLERSASALATRADEFVSDARSNYNDLTSASGTMESLDGAVSSVAGGARNLATMATTARETADRLGAAAQTNAAGLDQLAQTAKVTIDAANEVIEISESAGNNADSAAAAIMQADRTAEEAATVMNELVRAIETLRMGSSQIGSITAKIDEIADQTNLLALNAAIEAARAGEHGRGFAVVADEIRKLADSSARATREIASLISSVQTETQNAVLATRRGSDAVERGREKTTQVSDALERIVDSVSAVRARIASVVQSQREQKRATDSLVESTLLVERLTGDNAEMAGALSSLAVNLQQLSDSSTASVRTGRSDVQNVVTRGERMASASDEMRALTEAMRKEAERIRGTVADFHGDALGSSTQPRLTS